MSLQNTFFKVVGIGFLFLAKIKNILHGYSSPKPFDISETKRCIDYDIKVVDQWLFYLQKYTGNKGSIEGKNILELGPGSDLGIGLYLLSKGCTQYNACDVNDLMKATPDFFYDALFDEIDNINKNADIDFLKKQLQKSKAGITSKLNYVVHDDFDLISSFGKSSVDLVFSQAAFEHFDDIELTFLHLTSVCRPNAILIAEIVNVT